MNALTDRQQRVLDYIAGYVSQNGRPPAHLEIAAACQISSISIVHAEIAALETAGFIAVERKIARGIRVLEQAA